MCLAIAGPWGAVEGQGVEKEGVREADWTTLGSLGQDYEGAEVRSEQDHKLRQDPQSLP